MYVDSGVRHALSHLEIKTAFGHTYTTRYSYDSGDRVVSITYPDNRIVAYDRDSVGRITVVNATVNGVPVPIATGRTSTKHAIHDSS